MKQKTVILDLGGVLIDVDMHRSFEAFENLGINVKALLSAQKAQASDRPAATVCDGLTMSGVLCDYQVGEISSDDFLNLLLAVARPGTTRTELIDAWNSCLFTIPAHRIEVIRQLRQKYNVCMLSNTNELHWDYIVEKYFSKPGDTTAELFDRVFLSQEMHMAKPDRAIYQSVLEQLAVPAADCLFVDDATANLEAAASVGINTLHAPEGLNHISQIESVWQ